MRNNSILLINITNYSFISNKGTFVKFARNMSTLYIQAFAPFIIAHVHNNGTVSIQYFSFEWDLKHINCTKSHFLIVAKSVGFSKFISVDIIEGLKTKSAQ